MLSVLSASDIGGTHVMSNYIEYDDKMAFHPGYYINEIIENRGLAIDSIASQLGIPTNNLQLLICGEIDLSVDMANKLSKMFNTSVSYWINLQNKFDAFKAEVASK